MPSSAEPLAGPSAGPSAGPVVLVEGESDRHALLTLAGRLGQRLDGVDVVAMGGITNLPAHLAALPPTARPLVLYDAAEGRYVDHVMERTASPARLFACTEDLEDELVRALGVPRVLEVLEGAGDLGSFGILQQQPAHRGASEVAQLRRFFSAHSGHKLRYAGLLVEALDLDRLPEPLADLLAQV